MSSEARPDSLSNFGKHAHKYNLREETMKNRTLVREKGQSIVLIVLMLVGFIAMLALVLDGGNLFTHRRQMQTAADAGALAGATHLCGDEINHSAASLTANEYAVDRNLAQVATVTFPVGGTIEVTTSIDFEPFFLQFIGISSLSASATAAAKCEVPSGGNVMPIAWSCPPPPPDEEGEIPDRLCFYEYNECDPDDSSCDPPLYVFMDDTPGSCIYPPNSFGTPDWISGDVDCDTDNDDLDDVLLGPSSRGWLDLNDGTTSSTSDLEFKIVNACVNGIGENLADHTWVAAQPGVTAATFDVVKANCEGKEVIIPVFDVACTRNTTTPETDCVFDPPHDDDYIVRPGGGDYYHIVGFASFVITCVHADPSDSSRERLPDGSLGWVSRCPGRTELQFENLDWFGTNRSTPYTLEGYLNQDISPDVTGVGGVDSGTYVIYLTE